MKKYGRMSDGKSRGVIANAAIELMRRKDDRGLPLVEIHKQPNSSEPFAEFAVWIERDEEVGPLAVVSASRFKTRFDDESLFAIPIEPKTLSAINSNRVREARLA
jgi:hypothetical protein